MPISNSGFIKQNKNVNNNAFNDIILVSLVRKVIFQYQ